MANILIVLGENVVTFLLALYFRNFLDFDLIFSNILADQLVYITLSAISAEWLVSGHIQYWRSSPICQLGWSAYMGLARHSLWNACRIAREEDDRRGGGDGEGGNLLNI